MMRRFSLAFLMLIVLAGPLAAQRRRTVYSTDPGEWITAGVAAFRANGVNDGATASTWDFGNSTNFQYRASLEKGWTNGASFGLAGGWAHVPFLYTTTSQPPAVVSGAQCLSSCDAHLDMMTLVATFHAGSGMGFHQVLELNGGIVAYKNLKRDSDGVALAPSGGNVDPVFSFGYGFGYGLSDRTNIDFMWDQGIALHERKNLANDVSNTNSMPSLRLALRMGFGSRTSAR